ncbi:hypothetical protein MGH68_06815 [Erysipelothrix sp. D19-032]
MSPEFRNKDIAGSLVREVLRLNQTITVDIPGDKFTRKTVLSKFRIQVGSG